MKQVVLFLVFLIFAGPVLSQELPQIYLFQNFKVKVNRLKGSRYAECSLSEKGQTRLLGLVNRTLKDVQQTETDTNWWTVPPEIAKESIIPHVGDVLHVFYHSQYQGTVVASDFSVDQDGEMGYFYGHFGLVDKLVPSMVDNNKDWLWNALFVHLPADVRFQPEDQPQVESLSKSKALELFNFIADKAVLYRSQKQVDDWLANWDFGKSVSFPAKKVWMLELVAKNPNESSNRIIISRLGNKLFFQPELGNQIIDQAFRIAGQDYVVTTDISRGSNRVWICQVLPSKTHGQFVHQEATE